jgi:predicted FMN-binding regulatory protein PaiB
MYIPRHFREDDLAVLQTFMQEHSFATLVTQQDGVPRLMADNTELYDLLQTITQVNEANFENPWILQMPEEYLQKKLREIVGFQIEITRLEGKFKLSQNRSPRDQARVVAALQDTLSPDTAELMRKRQDK